MTSPSLRELRLGQTPQHAEGCTVDGNLLDLSMKDLVMGINNIPKRWLKRRFVHTQFVQRLMPAPYNVGALITQPSPPFLLLRNLVAQVTGAAPVDGLQNEWRTKGHDNPAIPEGAYEAPLVGVYGWTSALYFQKPVIITSLSLRCWQPTQYAWNNDWVYHADAPEPHEEGDYLEDLFMEISVDNPFNLENRELNDVELHKLRFSVGCQMMAEPALAVPNNGLNLAPCFTTQDLQLWVHLDNLCIPLHRDTRARITLGIPQYSSEGLDKTGWQGDDELYLPWQSTSFSLTTTVIEPLGDGQ